jgi:hypothetical protein
LILDLGVGVKLPDSNKKHMKTSLINSKSEILARNKFI